MDEGTPVWFRLTVDLATNRVVAERMTARARFMRHPLRGLRRGASGSRRRDDALAGRSRAARRRRAGRRGVRRPARLRADHARRRTRRSTTRSRAAGRRGAGVLARPRSRPVSDPGAAWQRAAADGEVSLDELRGTPLVVNFWASWCDPCRAEAKVLERACEAQDGVLFLGLDAQDAREDARDFIAQFGLTFPHVRDAGNDTQRAWGVTGLPETYFIGADGRVVGHVIGTVDDAQLRDGIEAAKAGRPAGHRRGRRAAAGQVGPADRARAWAGSASPTPARSWRRYAAASGSARRPGRRRGTPGPTRRGRRSGPPPTPARRRSSCSRRRRAGRSRSRATSRASRS